MNQKQIIAMALEAGFGFRTLDDEYCDGVDLPRGTISSLNGVSIRQVEKFAESVASHTRAEFGKEPPWPTPKQINAAAKMLAHCMDYPWRGMTEKAKERMREHAKAIIEAGTS